LWRGEIKNMDNLINSIVGSSDKIIKKIIAEHTYEAKIIKMENDYIFLFNLLNRFNQLTSSYLNTPNDKNISRFILLRPLILDSMLLFLLSKIGENKEWEKFHNIINDCLAEGVDKYIKTFYKLIEIDKLNEEDKNKTLKMFHYDYRYFLDETSTYKNPKLKNYNFKITSYDIKKELKGKSGYEKLEKLSIYYEILSKYEHSTIISIKLSKESKFENNLIPILENEIFLGFINLLNIISICYLKNNKKVFQLAINEIKLLKNELKSKKLPKIENPPQ
jgi:hypothetical protein